MERIQTIIDKIKAWQADDSQVTGIDLLLEIKAELSDIVKQDSAL